LQLALSCQGIDNIEILAPMGRDQLITEYQDADVLFLHLNDHDAFKRVLPTKVFEYGVLGKPIWAGVAGYAAEFLQSEIFNVTVFSLCDAEGAELAFERLIFRDIPSEFVEKYARKKLWNRWLVILWV
jgi:hypothetical protein